ncbi:hypothetical protein C4M98_00495 [Mycoplasmopsis pullorum]|uniref:hypothetical protein n=4 Tax=Mycoplasmopsis pullorum TaxID=48003 RepID=UPI0011199F4B|nr:hypothetical protein [Mycoplasmopsis pullorum]TNK82261.1 hypothetical protein C4M94_01485 [Mycoplasmopsis pullorum]TNK83156.1 hypothetical protein C4M80_01245 [Mycoplasmopsis pullorum]TNK86958.1 hypothetical protein C4M82_01470 [Mycoplasmopsis pullorum]TNK88837.1 hypothetical protein C4M89_01055 [Mycoplasmopsis pullorum]TNK89258.1 hypothetical protein C4M97_01760 [Mycoplasmopsis pullorum]
MKKILLLALASSPIFMIPICVAQKCTKKEEPVLEKPKEDVKPEKPKNDKSDTPKEPVSETSKEAESDTQKEPVENQPNATQDSEPENKWNPAKSKDNKDQKIKNKLFEKLIKALEKRYPESYDWSKASELEIAKYLVSKVFYDQQKYSSTHGKLSLSLETRITKLLNGADVSFSNRVYNVTMVNKISLRIDKVFEFLRQIKQMKGKKLHFYFEYSGTLLSKNNQFDWKQNITLMIYFENTELPKISSFNEAEQLFKESNLSHMEYDTKVENNTLYEQPYEMIVFTFNTPSEYKNALIELNSLFVSLGVRKKIPYRFKIWSKKLDFESENSISITDTSKMSWYNAKWSIGINISFFEGIKLKDISVAFSLRKYQYVDKFIQTNFIWDIKRTFVLNLYKKSIYSSDVDYWAWPKSWW